MTLGIEPGLLIIALHVSAGFAVFGSMVCAGVAVSGIHIRAIWWLAAMCAAAAGFQLCVASFHVAHNLEAAIEMQRWQNAWGATQLFSLAGFLAVFTRQRYQLPFLLGMGALFLVLILMSFTMPTGARFAGEFHSVVMELPWGERLQMLRGEPSRSVNGGRLLFSAVFAWGFYRVALQYFKEDKTTAIVMAAGLLILTLSIALGGLVESGRLEWIYFGGFGYIFFAVLALYLVVREMLVSNARLGETAAALQRELDSHQQTQKVVQHLAYYDTLTDLPSRAGLFERIRQPMEAARRNAGQLVMLHIDIDRFDVINDTLGPNIGDQLLQQVSRRLQAHMHGNDFVARMNADEFICVVTALPQVVDASLFAERLHEALRRPFEIDTHTLHITVSIGIAVYPDDAESAEALLTASDLATREAKRHGSNQTQFFRPELNAAIQERLHVGNAMRVALAGGQFELYFQPQISSRDGRITSLEALIRWHHPGEGLIMPNRFIPIAEETLMIVPIGAWVIDESCRMLAQWRKAGIFDIRVAVNLSAQQLHQPELLSVVTDALARHGLSGRDLELEITESMVMEDPDLCIAQLNKLSNLGIRLAMDDFGTGYSSLSYLKRLPIDTLKIDRSFVMDIEDNANDAAICATTISMATTLGLDTVAEGVETEVQADMLRNLNCERFQGFLYARPMPADAVVEFVRKYNQRGV